MGLVKINDRGSRREYAALRADALAEVNRLFYDKEFKCSDRNKRFLQYVTKKYFDGDGPKVKAYAIAVDVFKRPENFDPAIDPIVRIEATRLRAALNRYYDLHRRSIRISIPLGTYIPEFTRQTVEAEFELQAAGNSAPALGSQGTTYSQEMLGRSLRIPDRGIRWSIATAFGTGFLGGLSTISLFQFIMEQFE